MNVSTQVAHIRISREILASVIQKAYELSVPQGLGFLQFQEGPLAQAVVDSMIARSDDFHAQHPDVLYGKGIDMDYVSGRAVKLTIHRDNDGFFLKDTGRWYDHSDSQWQQLKDYVQQLDSGK